MRRSTGGCLTAFVAMFSRIALLTMWISRPVAWNATFSTAIVPCLGFLFLPFTTMVYAWLMMPGTNGVTGIQGTDWLWLGLALFSDVASIASAGYANRQAMPGYAGGTTPPPSAPVQTPPPSAPAQ
jgi:hypothetical protein